MRARNAPIAVIREYIFRECNKIKAFVGGKKAFRSLRKLLVQSCFFKAGSGSHLNVFPSFPDMKVVKTKENNLITYQ